MEKNTAENLSKTTNKEYVKSIERAMDILNCMCEFGSEIGVVEISHKIGLSAGTTHRLIRTLEHGGFVKQNVDTLKYSIGNKLIKIGVFALDNFQLDSISLPFIRSLSERLGETVNVGILDGGQISYINSIEGTKSVRVHVDINAKGYVHSTAIGKVLLSEMDRDKVKEIIASKGLIKQTENTITNTNLFLRELDISRERQYAYDIEEDQEDSMCIACPVRDYTNSIIAAVSVTGPVGRMQNRRKEVIQKLKMTAGEISKALGYDEQ